MPKYGFADRSAVHRRKRSYRQCQWQEALDQQALSVQVEAVSGEGRRRVVVARRETGGMVYCHGANGKRYRERDQFQVKASFRQSCVLTVNRGCCSEGEVATRFVATARAFGMRCIGVMRPLCYRGRLRNAIGVRIKGSREHFATRQQCRVEPECHPRQQQSHVRRPAPTQWQPDIGLAGEALHR